MIKSILFILINKIKQNVSLKQRDKFSLQSKNEPSFVPKIK